MRSSILPLLSTALACVLVASCQPSQSGPEENRSGKVRNGGETNAWGEAAFVHEVSDLPVDPDIHYGTLPNGVRYAIRSNDTPSRTATLLMRFDAGSFDETDETRGIAHFLEHMAFNGSAAIPEGEMIKRLERLGLAFGPDTNASTSFDATTYQLELPDVSDSLLTEALMIFRETAENLTLDPEAIDRERGVILAEKRARNSPGFRAAIAGLEFQTEGTGLVSMLPIGTEETIKSVTAEQFREFYNEQYRPEDTFITLVGDRPVEQLVRLIEQSFSDWEAAGGATDDAKLAPYDFDTPRYGAFADPEVTNVITLSTISPRPSEAERRDTVANRQKSATLSMAINMLNRRLAARVRDGSASYTSASVSVANGFDAARFASLSVGSEPDQREAAFIEAERELRRAIDHGFTQSELDEQIANSRKSYEVAVQTAGTRRTPSLARGILARFAAERVVTTPASSLERFNRLADDLSLADVNNAFRQEWGRLETAPQLYIQSDRAIDDYQSYLSSLLERSRSASLPAREDRDAGEFAYTDWGTAGKIASRERLEDIDVTLLTFENGVRINLKKTPYEDGVIRTRVRVGGGSALFPKDDPAFSWKIRSIMSRSALEAHTLDDLQTLMAGRTVSVSRNFAFENMTLSGSTVPDDFPLQMQLMAASLRFPAYRSDVIKPYASSIRSVWETIDSTPGRAANLYVPPLLSSNHWSDIYPTLPQAIDVDLETLETWYSTNVLNGAIEISLVGDFEEDAVIGAIASTFGALPERPSTFDDVPESAIDRRFPDGAQRPFEFTHAGEIDTGLLRIYWPVEGHDDILTQRLTAVLSDVLDLELTAALREEEGATYSPAAFASQSSLFPKWGYLGVSVEASPDDMTRLSGLIDDIAAKLVHEGVDDDVFDRAIQPTLEYLETSLESNAYWLDVIDQAQSRPEWLAYHRTRADMYAEITAEDVSERARDVFNPDAAIRVHILPEE